jgi:hypothetical protein
MASLAIFEILEKTSQQPVESQGEYIRTKYNPSVGQLIRYAYDATFQWDLPEGNPGYRKNIYLDQESNLYSQMRRLYIFMKGTGDHISQIKKETNFISILENVAPDDAELLIAAKDGSLPYGITLEFVEKELPGLILKPRESTPKAKYDQDNTFYQIDGQIALEEATNEPEPTFPEPETAPSKQDVAEPAKPAVKRPTPKKPVAKRKKPVVKKAKVAEK